MYWKCSCINLWTHFPPKTQKSHYFSLIPQPVECITETSSGVYFHKWHLNSFSVNCVIALRSFSCAAKLISIISIWCRFAFLPTLGCSSRNFGQIWVGSWHRVLRVAEAGVSACWRPVFPLRSTATQLQVETVPRPPGCFHCFGKPGSSPVQDTVEPSVVRSPPAFCLEMAAVLALWIPYLHE